MITSSSTGIPSVGDKETLLLARLEDLSKEISACKKCDDIGLNVTHIAPMRRGAGKKNVIVIGIQPGKTEIKEAEAFTGQAGKRLISWLIEAGVGKDREEIFSAAYFTSLCKCYTKHGQVEWDSVYNCLPFLTKQIEIIHPRICLTLGKEPLKALFGFESELKTVIGEGWKENSLDKTPTTLFSTRWFPDDCLIFPLPHPSPLSRWLNDSENEGMLHAALSRIKEHINALLA